MIAGMGKVSAYRESVTQPSDEDRVREMLAHGLTVPEIVVGRPSVETREGPGAEQTVWVTFRVEKGTKPSESTLDQLREFANFVQDAALMYGAQTRPQIRFLERVR
jgi:hypothetical protein